MNEGVDQSYTSEIFSFNASIVKSIRQLAVFPFLFRILFLEIPQKTINSMVLGFCPTKELTKCVKLTSRVWLQVESQSGFLATVLFVCFSFIFR